MSRLGVAFCLIALAAPALPNDAERFFDKRVAPILSKRCLGCHNEELKNGGVSFLDRDSLLKGGRRGPAIVPGKPEASVLIDSLRGDGGIQMPPGPKLPAKEVAILTKWISDGAVWGTKLRVKR